MDRNGIYKQDVFVGGFVIVLNIAISDTVVDSDTLP